MAPSWGDVIRVVVTSGAGVARGLGEGLDGMTTSRSVGSATGCSGPTGEGSSACCTACGIWSVTGDVGGGVWNAEVSGSAALCTDSVGISVGAVSGKVVSVGVGSADSVGPKGDEAVLAGCWTVSTPEPAGRLRVHGKKPLGLRSVTIRWVTGDRPTIPATDCHGT